MITKIKANKSFRGTTKYVLEKEKAKIIGGNMYGQSTSELVEQFTLSAHLNPKLKDPCYHLMVSVPKTDNTLTDEQLAIMSERHFATVVVLSRLKGDEAQVKQPDKRIADIKLKQLVDEFIETELPAYDFFIARHSDKEHDHTHIVASRVNNLDGKSIRTWNNYAHSEHSARLLEREFQLTQVQSSWESKQKAMTRNQLERVERDGLPGEEIMRRAIEQVADDKPTMPKFIERLWREHQVKAIVSYYGHGGVRGIKFGIDVGSVNKDGSPRILWKQGGNLNKYKCSFSKLQTELGISYEPKRDDSEIKRLNQLLESALIQPINHQKIDSIAASQTEAKPQLKPEKSADIYNHYSASLQNLLVTDRDKEIAVRALKDDQSVLDVEEILKASPAGWTQDEARALVLIANNKLLDEQKEPENSLSEKQRQEQELLAVAVPVAVELINWQLRETGRNILAFKHATLEKQGRELVFTHDERGEIFRVSVNRNQSGELEYSPINVGSIEREDHHFWQEAERVLQQIQEEKRQQLRKQSKGMSL
ncbi:MAG: relaxase/mobilization nuclease domain-containing protein [Nostoc sp. CmiSLP01]|nr:relaxase/mobilization nuclease domain-containing protein [Nostoc sp. CmiSLP01]MDZ8287556.1 relaxase/mobilization nuclease domain-containing protein [Nostoc sp. ChiSLP01]